MGINQLVSHVTSNTREHVLRMGWTQRLTYQDSVKDIEAMPAEMRMPRVGKPCAVDHLENHHASLSIAVQRYMLKIGVDVVDWEQNLFRSVGIDNSEIDGLCGRHFVASDITLTEILPFESVLDRIIPTVPR